MSKFLKDAIKLIETRDPFLPTHLEPRDDDVESDEFADEDRIVDVGDEDDVDGDDYSDLDIGDRIDFDDEMYKMRHEEQEEASVNSMDAFLEKWGTETHGLIMNKVLQYAMGAGSSSRNTPFLRHDAELAKNARELMADLKSALENYHATK